MRLNVFTVMFLLCSMFAVGWTPPANADTYNVDIDWTTPIPTNVPQILGQLSVSDDIAGLGSCTSGCGAVYEFDFIFDGIQVAEQEGFGVSGLQPTDTFEMVIGPGQQILNFYVSDITQGDQPMSFGYADESDGIPSGYLTPPSEFIDTFTITPAPEPSTGVLMLIGVGLLGLMTVMRKRIAKGLPQAT